MPTSKLATLPEPSTLPVSCSRGLSEEAVMVPQAHLVERKIAVNDTYGANTSNTFIAIFRGSIWHTHLLKEAHITVQLAA